MLRFAAVLLLAVSVSASPRPGPGKAKGTLDMGQLYSTYTMTGSQGVDGFFSIPRTVQEAEAMGWVTPAETKKNKLFRTLCKPDDPIICVLCDNKGSIAGYQLSVSTAVDSNGIKGMDWPKSGFKTQTLFGKRVYSNQIWFVPQEVLTSGGRDFNNQTGTGLWLQVKDKLVQVPIHESEMKTTKFLKQNCLPRMGQHYFWDMQADLKPEDFMPWFVLFSPEGVLNGFGAIIFGKQADLSANKQWLENVPAINIKGVAPGAPAWVPESGRKVGILSHHVYFSKEPWNINCPN